ncbi:MAG: diguanylate cyclase (GGDEF)-like protein/PAS domain S-box-containing protein [Ilumatobacter sp.]|jgi:diguanylate cyclase (GGDEF)-like protein/PAS domain S-box-containing protein
MSSDRSTSSLVGIDDLPPDACDPTSILDLLSEMVSQYHVSDHVITYCNASWAAHYGVDRHDAIGRRLDDFLSGHEMEGLREQLALLSPNGSVVVDETARTVSGESGRWLAWVDRYVTTGNGPEVLSVGRDVTDRHLAELRLLESEKRFRDLADMSSDIVWRIGTTPAPHFDYLSPSVERVLGYRAAYFLDDFDRLLEIADQDTQHQLQRIFQSDQAPERFDLRFRHANGSVVVCESTTTVDQTGVQGVARDVTEWRRTQRATAALALRDPLTGLSNRRGFDQMLSLALSRAAAGRTEVALAYLDLDGLKCINDQLGHNVGDIVLQETARRLELAVTGVRSAVVARLGGDEFAMVFEPGDIAASDLVERIDGHMSAPISIRHFNDVHCAVSVGVATTATAGRRAVDLVAAADHAMYADKRRRKAASRED